MSYSGYATPIDRGDIHKNQYEVSGGTTVPQCSQNFVKNIGYPGLDGILNILLPRKKRSKFGIVVNWCSTKYWSAINLPAAWIWQLSNEDRNDPTADCWKVPWEDSQPLARATSAVLDDEDEAEDGGVDVAVDEVAFVEDERPESSENDLSNPVPGLLVDDDDDEVGADDGADDDRVPRKRPTYLLLSIPATRVGALQY
ncbi:hypothetical protein BGX31_000843 [Mortierella sp. GBA43]|nr:hypothetical protein BGX31_000843 [Mortierella sp. GBA43]